MSTLNVSNITDGTTTVGTGYVVNGSAKAWITFNGFTISIGDSLNNSSVTDNGAGDYSTNHTSAFNSIEYTHTGGVTFSTSTTTAIFCIEGVDGLALSSVYQATSFRANTAYVTSANNRSDYDADRINLVYHGELA